MQVAWSKNVMDEHECPPQIIFGSNDIKFCMLAGIGSMLESRITANEQSKYLFGQPDRDDSDEPLRANSRYTNALRNMWKKKQVLKDLIRLTKGEIGSHSLRKLAATMSVRKGCTEQETEIRGRWKGKRGGSIVNRYINPSQLPIDAKVAAALCGEGPVWYKVKADSGVTDQFLKEFVVPGIVHFFS